MNSFKRRIQLAKRAVINKVKRNVFYARKKAAQAKYMREYFAAQKIQKMVRGMNSRVNLKRRKPWYKGFVTTAGNKFLRYGKFSSGNRKFVKF